MPLLENQRAFFVDDLRTVDFFYGGFDPQVEVYRWGEGFSQEHPFILVKFLPANRKKFQSLSDVIGIASGRFHEYGMCHIELVTISVYCNEYHRNDEDSVAINGRLLCDFIANQCLTRVLKDWERLLKNYGACFDRKDTIPVIKDLSGYDRETATMKYNYEFDIILRTQLRWNKVPDGYDENEDFAERANVSFDPNGDEDKRFTIIINTS